ARPDALHLRAEELRQRRGGTPLAPRLVVVRIRDGRKLRQRPSGGQARDRETQCDSHRCSHEDPLSSSGWTLAHVSLPGWAAGRPYATASVESPRPRVTLCCLSTARASDPSSFFAAASRRVSAQRRGQPCDPVADLALAERSVPEKHAAPARRAQV